ncbi:ScbA/BarX family gamma-butyrolactone biosynthesis protein [Streptomyces sp. NPDC047315]|uniref:ScbA/BarX family gamma-butyrolactone biosynthesis protein n=1 Tax=Streptomyces sp. NPDC047315 TaxID=3155142 RepID=UPI0033D1E059
MQTTASTSTLHRQWVRQPARHLRPTDPGQQQPLRLTTTVPKEFVHRAALAEVLLSDWDRRGPLHFAVTAQWPRHHSFFSLTPATHYDPLLAAETIRQSVTLLSHAELGVPLGYQFLLSELSVSVQPQHLRIGATPAGIDVDVTFPELRERRGTPTGGRFEAVLRSGRRVVATGSGTYTCMNPTVYRRVRGELSGTVVPLTAPVPPQSVGRMSPMDVVLSPIGEPDRWTLRVDTQHPILFDHPVDHVPGMLLIEAARQAAISLLGPSFQLPLAIESAFVRYVELDAPCVIEARRVDSAHGGTAMQIRGLQGGAEAFLATVTADPAPLV